jgi:demethylmenaquinone methyltransferase/2-methoxy-6-polyprenyl-1,4-benzoquinol methylase
MRAWEKAYYDRRAGEYDAWWKGTGIFAARERPGWDAEVARLIDVVRELEPATTLDVACGTGFLTQHLRGEVTLLDQSEAMLAIARERLPSAHAVRADAPPLPFADGSFERLFTSHFYGHLREEVRVAFLADARRVAGELVVVDAAGGDREETQERTLNDGSRHRVYKRWFSGSTLAAELEGEVVAEGDWFVVVRA